MPLTQFRIDLPAIADPHMQGPIVQTLLGSVGAQMDANADQIMWARLQGNPFAGGPTPSREGGARLADGRLIECEPFVLPIHSAQRGIRLYATEPVLSQRIRLSRHLELKRQRGTPWGVIEHVRPYFATAAAYPTIRVVFQTNEATPAAIWYAVAPDGTRSIFRKSPSNWDWDGLPVKRARWWAIIHLPAGFASSDLWDGSATWDGAALWDGIPAAVIADLWSMFYDWKAAHSRFSGLILTTLQPNDDIPGFVAGHHPFDPTATALTHTDGWTTLPLSNWWEPVYTGASYTGLPTRPSWALFYNIDNG